jgi:predicted O-methyltransferase YrrM
MTSMGADAEPISAFTFCPVLNELLQHGCAVGKSGKVFEHLGALSTRHNLETIRRLMLYHRPRHTLEIGFAFGGSALVFCASHQELGHPPEHQHTLIDPYQMTVWDSCGLMALDRAGLSGFAELKTQASATALPKMLEAEAHFGLVYIDGSHLFEDLFVDAYYVTRMLTRGGIVAFDDSTSPHVAKVLKFIRGSMRLGLEEVDLTRFRGSRPSLGYRLARRLGKVQMTAFRRIGDVERAWDAPFDTF